MLWVWGWGGSLGHARLPAGAGCLRHGPGVPLFQVADSWPWGFNHGFYSSELFNKGVEFPFGSWQGFGDC